MITSVDQLGDTIRLEDFPKRIVSLVPSQTELLFDLGLGDRVVGITKFCVHPTKWYKTKTRVGGTKSVDLERVKYLNPDLIIANKEENQKEQIEALRKVAPIWISDIYNLDDSLDMIHSIGELCGVDQRASELIQRIVSEFCQLPQMSGTVAYYIWKSPYMLAGKSTFIDNMLSQIGLTNAVDLERYPVVDREEVTSDFVFLSSEPYPFNEEHVKEWEDLFPTSKVVVVDGEYFSWYGSRLVKAPNYFKELTRKLNQT